MELVHTIAMAQSWLLLAFKIVVWVFQILAFVDASRYRADAYPAANKQPKRTWLLILGASAFLGFLSLPPLQAMPLFVLLIGVVVTVVYFSDVRKALRAVDPRFNQR